VGNAFPLAGLEFGVNTVGVVPKPGHAGLLEGIHVLIVEDDQDTLSIFGQYLAHLGALVTMVRSAAEAIVSLQRVRADVIISDLAMPITDGLTFIRQVRRLPGESEIPTPAIALTGYSGYQKRAIDAGFQVYLMKPVDPLIVAKEVARLADHRSR